MLKYVELSLLYTFPSHSLRITYQPADGAMMIDLSTIKALELIQNLQNSKSKDCLFGLLNQTQTPMGARVLKSNVLQPLTSAAYLMKRYDALEELTTREDIFFAVRQGMPKDLGHTITLLIVMAALKAFVDVDRVLTAVSCDLTCGNLVPDKSDHSDPCQTLHSVFRTINQQCHRIQTIREIDPSNLRSTWNCKK